MSSSSAVIFILFMPCTYSFGLVYSTPQRYSATFLPGLASYPCQYPLWYSAMFLSSAPSYICQYPLAVLCYVYAWNGILSITVPLSGTLLRSCLLWHLTLVSTTTAVPCYVSTWFGLLLSLVPSTVSLLLFPPLLPFLFLSQHSLLRYPYIIPFA